jgi:tetratricopeptide (TPR) repeat protein
MTTIQQQAAPVEVAALHQLYEAGDFPEALRLLDASGLLTVLEERTDDPTLTGAALVVANLYRDLGRFSAAEPFYLQALAGRALVPGKDHPEYACGLVELGHLYAQLGRHKQALALFEQARTVHETTVTPDPVAHACCLRALAEVYDDLDRRRDARACLTQARTLLEQSNAAPVELADLLLSEAWALFRLRGGMDSVSRARQALAIYREHKGEDHPGTLHAGYRLGRLLLSLCQLDEAAPLIERAVHVRRQRFGEESPRPILDLGTLATLRLVQGEPREAERLARHSLQLLQSTLGDRHPYVADGYQKVGNILLADHQLTGARESFEQALQIVRDVFAEGHSRAVELELELAEIDEATGRHGDAVERLRGVLELLDRHPDDVRYEQVVANLALARLSLHAGRLDDAEPLIARARELAGQFPTTDPFLHGRALVLAAQLRASRGDFAAAGALLGQARQALAGLPPHHPMVTEADAAHASLAGLRGDTAAAVRLARESARRVEQAGGERSPWLPQVLCFLAEQLHLAGDFTESEKVYERALDVQRRRRGADHPDLVTSLRGLARLHLSRGNAAAALVRFRQALEIRTNALGDNHPDTAESLNDLASLQQQLGDLLTAEALFRRALVIRRECLEANHPETLTSQHNLALVLAGRGETAEAADLLEKAVALTEPAHPQRLNLQHTLAMLCNARGERVRAQDLLRELLAAQEKAFGHNHAALIPVLRDLALVQAGLGDHLGAREQVERIHSARAAFPLPDPLGQALDLVKLSDSHLQLGDAERAWSLAQQALAAARRHLPPRNPGLVGYLTHCARAAQARRSYRAAWRLYHEALRLVVDAGGRQHPLAAALWSDLAGLEAARGKPRQATPLYERSAEMFRAVVGEDHPDHAAARRMLGVHLRTQGEYARAEAELTRHLEIVRRTAGAEHPVVALAHQQLAELRRQRGDLAGAERDCRQALDLVRRFEVPADAVHANLLHGLGMLVRQQGRLDEAADLLRRALEIDRASTGEEGRAHLESLLELAQVEAARGNDRVAQESFHRLLSAQEELLASYVCLPPGLGRDQLLCTPWRLTESLLTLALRQAGGVNHALEAVLRWKALPPAEFALRGREAERRRHPSLAREIDRLFDLGMQTGGRLIQGVGQEGLQVHRDLLRRWGEEQRELEERLASSVPALARLRALRTVRASGIRQALSAGTTLVELVYFRPRDFAAICAGRDGMLPARYLAFVLGGGEEDTFLVDLGLAADLERRGGWKQVGSALGTHLGCHRLIVAADGRLGLPVFKRLVGPDIETRKVRSGRELLSPLQARVRSGWLGRLGSWWGWRTGCWSVFCGCSRGDKQQGEP